MSREPSVFTDPDHYPAISLWQPWAGLIWLAGMGFPRCKDIETRKRRIRYQGPLVICAASNFVDMHAENRAFEELVLGGHVPHEVFLSACRVRGVALARFDVSGCRPLVEADRPRAHFYEPGRFAWTSSRIAALQPFPAKGSQGFFRISRAAVDEAVLMVTLTPISAAA